MAVDPKTVSTVGQVRAIRVVRTGVQAEVCLGFTPTHGNAWLQITSSSPKVREALGALEEALVDSADVLLTVSQDERRKRGQRVIG